MGGLVARIASVAMKQEGAYRDGPYALPLSGGWLPAGSAWNFWQLGQDVQGGGRSHMVEACVSAYSQTVAMCPGNHWAWTKGAGRDRVPTSALTRVIRKPNAYQSISDFLLNAVRDMLDGEAFALALRNDRFEITELHWMNPRQSWAQTAESGEIFYHLGGNEVIDQMSGRKSLIVPARDVLHLKMHCPRSPLVGESPLVAAALAMAAGNAALQQQVIFYANQARPSFILSTEQKLTPQQAAELRQAWNEQSQGLAAGQTPILGGGITPHPISVSAVDSQLADMLKLSDQAIATAYRVPLAILGLNDKAFASTEALMHFWLASGLGFVLNHVEEAMGNLFKLKGQPDEYLEFDTSALQRSSFKDRMEGWAAGTKGGIIARNEARREFEFAPVEGGDEPWVQQQDIPLSVAYENAKSPPDPAPPPAIAPPANDEPTAEDADKALAEAVTRHLEAARAV